MAGSWLAGLVGLDLGSTLNIWLEAQRLVSPRFRVPWLCWVRFFSGSPATWEISGLLQYAHLWDSFS